MKKLLVISIIFVWLFMGYMGHGLADGYLHGHYPNSRFPTNTIIPPKITFYLGAAFSSLFGPIGLAASALYLGNDRERWSYPIQWHYYSNLERQE